MEQAFIVAGMAVGNLPYFKFVIDVFNWFHECVLGGLRGGWESCDWNGWMKMILKEGGGVCKRRDFALPMDKGTFHI